MYDGPPSLGPIVNGRNTQGIKRLGEGIATKVLSEQSHH